MSLLSRDGTIGFVALCLISAAIVQARSTDSPMERPYAPPVSADTKMTMVKPRELPPFELKKPKRPHKGLRQKSPEKREWHEMYLKGLAFHFGLDPTCRRCLHATATEGHHPYGQQGAWIMIFAPVCRECHNEIENNKKKSRQEGWILYL